VPVARSDHSAGAPPARSTPIPERSLRVSLRTSRSLRGAAWLTLLSLGGVGFLPLFGGPGYEAALAAGLLLPMLSAAASALELARPRPPGSALSGPRALAFGISSGALLASIALIVSLLHGARSGFCDVSDGVALMLLGPGFGSVMGGAWGVLAAAWVRGIGPARASLWAVLAALAGPLGGIALSLWRFYTSPVVFAFDPFFGYFAGPLYDTVIDPLRRLSSYRLGSLMTLLAAWAFAGYVAQDSQKLAFRYEGRWGQALAGAGAAALSLAIAVFGSRLGHNTSTASILEILSRRLSHGRCDVSYDPSVVRTQVELLARDCQAHLEGLERYFDARGPDRVHVLLFANAQQKGQLMGASHTLIAKPWRHEIYLHPDQYPHPVLRHELAHVVAGRFGQGPFRIAGKLGGLWPDPGRIEGFAEAAAPREHSDFTVTEWTAAMLDAGLLPRLDSIFQLRFLGHNSATAYSVAGAFVTWLRDRYGAGALKAWYAGAGLETVTGGKTLRVLDREFRARLAAVPLSDRLRVAAKARFSAPSIFGRRCPHTVDERFVQAQTLLGASDLKGAEAAFRDVLKLDPDHIGARLGIGHCALRRAEPTLALAAYAAVATDERLTVGDRLAARESIANTEFMAGRRAAAARIYRELLEQVASEAHLRNIQVKLLATQSHGLEYEALSALLLGTFREPPTWDIAAPLLGAWQERDPEHGLSPYLIGKNLFGRAHFRESARYLDEALGRELRLQGVEREALWLRVIIGCAERQQATVRQALKRFLALEDTTVNRRQAALAVAARCGVLP
jgi:tetratricopeptide (TPR) repeat protein